ncbi:MAG TPA: DUF2063 domain-containing protein [Cyanothece sp. UBA12306]|nr:DUF2063 domain-containing protein [Cyanothece sp. UBA12306]
MELKKIQQEFYQVLLNSNLANNNDFNLLIKSANNLTPNQGIDIYRGTIIGQLHRVMQGIYPVCCKLVGDSFFNFTVAKYIDNNPGISPDLGNYGANFPDFLQSFEPISQLPYLADVARLELGYQLVFNGQKDNKLDIQDLANIPQEQWNNIIFHLPKNRFLLESNYPIDRIWEVNQPDYQGEGVVNLNEGNSQILIWRQDYQMRLDLPNQEQWQFIKCLADNQPLEVICNQLENGGYLLSELVQKGWITGFSLSY